MESMGRAVANEARARLPCEMSRLEVRSFPCTLRVPFFFEVRPATPSVVLSVLAMTRILLGSGRGRNHVRERE